MNERDTYVAVGSERVKQYILSLTKQFFILYISRFIFSNRLGLFVAWFPSHFGNVASDKPTNCAILLPVKLKPFLKLCSTRHNFVSIYEFDTTLNILTPDNRLIQVPHEYIRKQYRLYNNLEINLDNFNLVDIFQNTFKCSEPQPPSKEVLNQIRPKREVIYYLEITYNLYSWLSILFVLGFIVLVTIIYVIVYILYQNWKSKALPVEKKPIGRLLPLFIHC